MSFPWGLLHPSLVCSPDLLECGVFLEMTNLVFTPGPIPPPCTWGASPCPLIPLFHCLPLPWMLVSAWARSSNPVAFSPLAPCPGSHRNSCGRVTQLVSADSSQASPHLPGRTPSLSPTCLSRDCVLFMVLALACRRCSVCLELFLGSLLCPVF